MEYKIKVDKTGMEYAYNLSVDTSKRVQYNVTIVVGARHNMIDLRMITIKIMCNNLIM